MKKQSVYNPTPPRGALILLTHKRQTNKRKNCLIVVERSKTGKKYSVKVKKRKRIYTYGHSPLSGAASCLDDPVFYFLMLGF